MCNPVYTTRRGAVLVLRRLYHNDGTVGAISYRGKVLCFTIERAWVNNQVNVSCIPSGVYGLKKALYKGKPAVQVMDVPCRSGIYIHPANDASKELRGCIAPVSALTGSDTGVQSKKAMDHLLMLMDELIETRGSVALFVTGSPRKRFRKPKETRS